VSRGDEADLLIHPCPKSRRQALLQILAGFDADCVATLEQQQAQKLPVQDRESL
jgi:antitoxin VapB